MKWKRALVVTGICVAVLLGCGYGAYRYVLSKYAQHIDNLLVDLIADAGSNQAPIDSTPTPGTSSPGIKPDTNAPATPSQVDPETASKATTILEQMNLSEKVTVMRAMSKFTTGELLEMYKQYASGDKNDKQSVKQLLEDSFTEEDLLLFRQIAEKYR